MIEQSKSVEIILRESIIQLQLASMYPAIPDPGVDDMDKSHKHSFWSTVKNSLLGMGVARWYQVFGSHSEKTHWKKLEWQDAELVKNRFLDNADIDHDGWVEFHRNAQNVRNRFIAHVDFDNEAPNLFRDSDQLIFLKTSLSLRDDIIGEFKSLLNSGYEYSTDELAYLKYVVLLSSEEIQNQAKNMYKQGMRSFDLT